MSGSKNTIRNLQKKLARREKKISELEATIQRDIRRFIEDLQYRHKVSSAMKDMAERFKDERYDRRYILEVITLLAEDFSKEPEA